jgi:hypothetical protein
MFTMNCETAMGSFKTAVLRLTKNIPFLPIAKIIERTEDGDKSSFFGRSDDG